MICRLCGAEKDTRRQMHGHLMRSHYDDYKLGDFILDRFAEGAPAAVRERKKEIKKFERPAGFRFLNSDDPEELNALKLGYQFIDSDTNVYTLEESKIEGWV